MEIFLKYTEHLASDWYNIQRPDKSLEFNNRTKERINIVKSCWRSACDDFSKKISENACDMTYALFGYIKSCEYTDKLIETKVQEVNIETQDLKSLVYSMLDEINELKEHNKSLSLSSETQELKSLVMLNEINELKEHNKSLSERIDFLEKPPVIYGLLDEILY